MFSLVCTTGISNTKTEVKKGPDSKAGKVELLPLADTYIATYPPGKRDARVKNSEQGGNAGLTTRLKIKKYENMPLMKFDFSGIPEGATITKAFIDFKMMKGAILNQVTVSSHHVDWNEGKGTFDDGENYKLDHDGACYFGPKGINSSWRKFADSDFFLTFNGEGGSCMTIVKSEMVDDSTCRIPIDPLVMHAAIENGSSLVFSDHTASFTGPGQNIFFHSRESKGNEPKLTVEWADGRDKVAPAFKGAPKVKPGPVAGSIMLTLPEAGDDGTEGKAVGYRVWLNGKEVDRLDLPRPNRAWRTTVIEGLTPGQSGPMKIMAFDEAGNSVTTMGIATARAAFTGALADGLPGQNKAGKVHKANEFSAALIDGMTLVNPVTGKPTGKQVRANGLAPIASVGATKGEILGFQCLITPNAAMEGFTVKATDFTSGDNKIAASGIEFFNEIYVKVEDTWIADILPQLKDREVFNIPSQKDLPEQKTHAIYVDIWVPQSTPAGTYSGTINVNSQKESIALPLNIVVRDVTLPNTLGFTVEMNAYGHAKDIDIFHNTYKLCHKHRLSYNVVPYSHTRPGNFTAPKLNSDEAKVKSGKEVRIIDWTAYDQYFAPIFSGDIAKDLPRANEPATHWYLPFHEGWPYDLKKVNPKLWKGRPARPKDDKAGYEAWKQYLAENDPMLEDHFDKNWREANKNVGDQFKSHFAEKGWTKTRMQIFSNHKNYFPTGSQSLWVMDEPQIGRDFEALGGMYKIQNSYLSGSEMNVSMRADISRPQKMGSFMDEGMSEVVVSSLAALYITHMRNYIEANNQMYWWYGGGGHADADPAATIALFAAKWSMGCVGGMPVYTTFANSNDWTKAGRLRVVRFDETNGQPVASFRMKAYRRAQQDMELLTMLEKKKGFNRWHIASLLAKEVNLKMVTISTRPDDPGYSTFENLDNGNFDKLREKLVATLLK